MRIVITRVCMPPRPLYPHAGAHCIECEKEHSMDVVREAVMREEPLMCSRCKHGLVKPDIVFFGEGLPDAFFEV